MTSLCSYPNNKRGTNGCPDTERRRCDVISVIAFLCGSVNDHDFPAQVAMGKALQKKNNYYLAFLLSEKYDY